MSVLEKLRSRESQVVAVATKHIPYVETLFNRVEAAKSSLTTKEEYIRTASQLGIKVAAFETLAERATVGAKDVRLAEAGLVRIKMVLAAGCEPTTPPSEWWCGHLTEPKKVKTTNRWGDPVKEWPAETWPQGLRYSRIDPTTRVYHGPMPVEALRRYAAVQPLLDDARVYSPREEDFSELRNPEPRDPVLIGLIDFLGERQYFEVSRWDIDQDLATLFSRAGR